MWKNVSQMSRAVETHWNRISHETMETLKQLNPQTKIENKKTKIKLCFAKFWKIIEKAGRRELYSKHWSLLWKNVLQMSAFRVESNMLCLFPPLLVSLGKNTRSCVFKVCTEITGPWHLGMRFASPEPSPPGFASVKKMSQWFPGLLGPLAAALLAFSPC